MHGYRLFTQVQSKLRMARIPRGMLVTCSLFSCCSGSTDEWNVCLLEIAISFGAIHHLIETG
jgi:hypothetical protein